MDAQQMEQTQIMIEEMLNFLESASEDEDVPLDIKNSISTLRNQCVNNGCEDEENSEKLTENESKSSIVNELKKSAGDYPVWNTQEISQKSTYTLSSSSTIVDEPIWNGEPAFVKAIGKPTDRLEEDLPLKAIYDDWCNKVETKSFNTDEDEDLYIQEVHKAMFGDMPEHPIPGSSQYFKAAQNYAVFGDYFLDFPKNLEDVINCESDCRAIKNEDAGGSQAHALQDEKLKDAYNLNDFGKQSSSNAHAHDTSSATGAPTVAAVTSTAAYYQLCNGIQQRPGSSNSAMGTSTTYGMFLGNKVTYVAAAPAAPTLVYNQQTAATANFVSNSLANAALATSPTILYSNPMLNATTQQYLNAFFKEIQLLNTGGTSSQTTTATAFYERLVYAQILQQQIYHQNQQAAAVAAMMQHKQRVNAAALAAAAAAAAAVAARQTSSASTNLTTSNGNSGITTSASNVTSIGGASSSTTSAFPSLNMCGRQASMMAGSNTGDLVTNKQQGSAGASQSQPINVNGCEKSLNANKE